MRDTGTQDKAGFTKGLCLAIWLLVITAIVIAILVNSGVIAPKNKPGSPTSLTEDDILNSIPLVLAEDGEVTLSPDPVEADPLEGVAPDQVWTAAPPPAGSYTLPAAIIQDDSYLGILNIPRIGLSVGVYQADNEIEAMAHGVAHLSETSAWNGNMGMAGHNRGVNTYFGRLGELELGNRITYATSEGSRTYSVIYSAVIDEMDWDMLSVTEDNRITLITCISNQPTKRLAVQAVEVSN